MEQSEIMRRVVGILTEAIEMRRQVREHPGDKVALTGAVSALLTETLPGERLLRAKDAQTVVGSEFLVVLEVERGRR